VGSELYGVSCTAVGTCIAVGRSITGGFGAIDVPLAEVWDGSTWTIQSGPNLSSAGPGDAELNAVSCALPTVCTAVGDFYDAGAGQLLSERYS
jgi:hypothetical protein